ncbi:MAG: amidohydrolase family protein [Solirubrobacteraceae bacterium]
MSTASGLADCHCHAWRRWPYAPPVPDEHTRATAEQLIFEMDRHGVGQALVVSAAIDGNPDNLEYVAAACARHAGRLHLVADLDCPWSDTYHAPGGARRLAGLCEQHPLVGVAHYLGERNDGWLAGDEADAVFALAARRGLIISLGASPAWQADLRAIAGRHPDVPVLCHILGGIWVGGDTVIGLDEALAGAAVPSIYLKLAGFHYCAADGWDYPWPGAVAALERLYDAYGPQRLCWGSDFPAATRFCTYRQALEVVRTHCRFLGADERALVLGGNLRRLLAARGPGAGQRGTRTVSAVSSDHGS